MSIMTNIIRQEYVSDLFNIYIEQFEIFEKKIKNMIESMHSVPQTEFSKVAMDIQKNLNEACRILKQMEIEIGLLKTAKRTVFSIFNNRYDSLVKSFKIAKENFNVRKNTQELIITINSNEEYGDSKKSNEKAQKEKLLKCEEIPLRSSFKLDIAKQNVIEIEKISKDICGNLNKQTDDLLLINSKVSKIDSELSSGNVIMRRITNRFSKNKAMMVLFSVALVCTFTLVLYTKYI
jgi:hypothetical protein